MKESLSTSVETLLNFFMMYFTAGLKSLLTAKSKTSLFRLLLKGNGSFEAVADTDLLWLFIYTGQVFIGSGRRLNADLWMEPHKKPRSLWL